VFSLIFKPISIAAWVEEEVFNVRDLLQPLCIFFDDVHLKMISKVASL